VLSFRAKKRSLPPLLDRVTRNELEHGVQEVPATSIA